jgi:MFS family permease
VVIVGAVSAVSVGKLLGKIAPAWIMVTGGVAYTTGSILAATRPPETIYWTYFFFSVIIQVVGMDTSFPAASIIFANAVPKRLQGMGASVVMTIVNYSISLGLGFAGTLETNINHGGLTPEDRLYGYRGALWLGVGLGGLALALSLIFMAKTLWRDKRRPTET